MRRGFGAVLLVVAPLATADQGQTALDLARILAGQSGPMDQETLDELFNTAFTANMRVPPEHLGVAFYDKRSGDVLDPAEVRALMGPVRQDGAHELLDMVAPWLQARLPLEVEQLQLLMDAAFLASMRQPPGHIDIEYYDRRTGPSGLGGGVSGRVPEPVPDKTASAAAELPSEPASVPADKAELLARMKTMDFGVSVEEMDHLLYPTVIWGRDDEEVDALLQEYVEDAARFGLTLHGTLGEPHVEHEDGWIITYALNHASSDNEVLVNELRTFMEALEAD